jgi:quercetin dioxygenase-like cupin family protein
MRPTKLLVTALLLSGCAATQPPHHHEATELGHQPVPTILRADEGEKLLMYGGRYVLLKTTADGVGARDLFMGSEALPPGTAIPVHSHDGYEEIIFIHEGNARLTLGDEEVVVEPGTTMFVPPGTWHGVAAHGDEETTMLFIFPEPEIVEFFRSVGYEEGGEPPTLTAEDWAEIMEQHRMRARED